MRKVQIEIGADARELADRMVRIFVAAASEAVSALGVFRVALSGGRTPEAFLRRLAERPFSDAPPVPWDRIHVFWVDERYVPPESPASNYRLVAATLLSRVEIPAAHVHRIPTEDPDPAASARAYERTIWEVFGLPARDDPDPVRAPRFDLILLGMGQDAHTASLFPGHEPRATSRDSLVAAVHVAGVANPDRITLTSAVLQAARRLVVQVAGAEKAQILKEVLGSEPDERRYPIHVLWPVLDRVTWLVDRAAAGELG